MRDVLFWLAVVGVLVGVTLELLFPFGWPLAVFLAVLGVGIYAALMHQRRTFAIAGVIICAALSFGILRVVLYEHTAHTVFDSQLGSEITIDGVVIFEPDERERTVRITVEVDEGNRIITSVPRPVDVVYGERIEIRGLLVRPTPFFSDSSDGEADGGRRFNYSAYLAKDGVFYELKFPEVVSVGERETAGFGRAYLFALKQKYLEGLARVLPQSEAALAGGITVGDKRALGGNMLDIFRITGIIHIVVLSGYNITIVADSIRRLFRGLPKVWEIGASAITILAFVIMTGASATGVRAGAMASLALLAGLTGRRYAITRALALTAVGMVLWSPHILLYDPGFQLSVVATVGLIHVAPVIERYLGWVTETFGLRGIVAATLGTQFAVLPLLLWQVGLLSLVAVPVNLLVLPLIPTAMFFSFFAGLFGAAIGTSGVIFATPAHLLLSYSLWVVDVFAKIPFAAVSISAFSFVWVVVAYAVLLLGLYYFLTRSAEL